MVKMRTRKRKLMRRKRGRRQRGWGDCALSWNLSKREKVECQSLSIAWILRACDGFVGHAQGGRHPL
jgi:hypothetical protein